MNLKEAICDRVCKYIFEENEELKRLLNEATPNNPFVLGIGSGSTIVPLINLLPQYINKHIKHPYAMQCVACIPTSSQTSYLIANHEIANDSRLRLSSLREFSSVVVDIDGADEILQEPDLQFSLIKGGGGCHTEEKIVAEASKLLIIVADKAKLSENSIAFSKAIPIEVIPNGINSVINNLVSLIGKDFIESIVIRESQIGKIGPVITDNGNYLVDLKLKKEIYEKYEKSRINSILLSVSGVVDTGLFIGMKPKIFLGEDRGNGTMEIKVL